MAEDYSLDLSNIARVFDSKLKKIEPFKTQDGFYNLKGSNISSDLDLTQFQKEQEPHEADSIA